MPDRPLVSNTWKDLLEEPDSEIRTRKLAAELGRLTAELEQAQRKVVEEQDRRDELEKLIKMNPDTALPTHRVFLADLEQHLEASQNDADKPFIIGIIRLDSAYQHLKNSRDRNKVLLFKTTIRIREIIGDALYQSDRIDEFFVLLREFKNEDEVLRTFASTIREVMKPHQTTSEDVSFGCHVAFVQFPLHGTKSSELLMNGEIALRYGVQKKKALVQYTGALGEAYHHHVRLEQELHTAAQSGFENFYLVYQPFVDGTDTIRGCESLIRWKHPDLGHIPPPKFIPIAERSGDIRVFGRWILYKSCLQLRDWLQNAGKASDGLFVSVNLSAVQFAQKDLVDNIVDLIQAIGLQGPQLKLEVTESALMADPQDAIDKLKKLRTKGILIALDDFGTGYSSLNYLRKLPIDTLKIDKSFVDDVTVNVSNQEIVRAILAMARSLNIETLAEGVETKEQRDLLINEGCKYIQGYYYSKPVEGDRFLEYLKAGGKLP